MSIADKKQASDTLHTTDHDEHNKKEAEGKPGEKTFNAPVKIVNAKDEPPFKLKLSHEQLIFKYAMGAQGYETFTVINDQKVKYAFKVKSSDNKVFTSRPSVGMIEPGQKAFIKAIYLNPNGLTEAKDMKVPEWKVHLAIYHVSADAKTTTYKEAFAKKNDFGVFHFPIGHKVDTSQTAENAEVADENKKE